MRGRKDPAPAGMRDQVAAAAAQAWREPVMPYYLGRSIRTKVTFAVPGLRPNGTPAGRNRIGHGVVVALRIVGYVLLAVVVIAWLVLSIMSNSGGSDSGFGTGGWRRRIAVRAPSARTDAAACGLALRRARGHVWLVTAPSTVAVVAVARGRQRVLWSGRRPGLTTSPFELTWPDGSSVHLSLPGKESRLHAGRG
jgi:hypothetical protein